MSGKLEKMLAEAKAGLIPRVKPDWDAVDAKLFARIAADEKAAADARVARLTDRSRAWGIVAGGLAAAAAIALFATRKPVEPPLTRGGEPVAANGAALTASVLAQKKGAGSVLVGGELLARGANVRVNDAVETRGATAYFERAPTASSGPDAKAAVTWALEDGSRVAITRAAGTLILALERGAVEAQVTPVPSGEAFAIDVAAPDGAITRVAVHGTHLRVAREERAGKVRVVVDLTEGVIAIGAPPRTGATYGALVSAPAHAELDAANPGGTLTVSHAKGDVRGAMDLAGAIAEAAPVAVAPTAPAHDATGALASARDTSSRRPFSPKPAVVGRSGRDADADPEQTIAAAVKACMAAHPAPADDQLKVTIRSALELSVSESGSVELARFDPPLPPDVQSCAAEAIYKTRFASGGNVRIPLDLSR